MNIVDRISESISGAVFNDSNRRFRYALWRFWQPRGDKLLFIGLNPSTANDIKDDPTICKLINFAKFWGFGGLFCGNLFSLVSANPAALFVTPSVELVGGPNDHALKRMRELSTKVMVGWGNEGRFAGTRPQEVLSLLGEPVYCLAITHTGDPRHPLYTRSTSQLVPYVRKTK